MPILCAQRTMLPFQILLLNEQVSKAFVGISDYKYTDNHYQMLFLKYS